MSSENFNFFENFKKLTVSYFNNLFIKKVPDFIIPPEKEFLKTTIIKFKEFIEDKESIEFYDQQYHEFIFRLNFIYSEISVLKTMNSENDWYYFKPSIDDQKSWITFYKLQIIFIWLYSSLDKMIFKHYLLNHHSWEKNIQNNKNVDSKDYEKLFKENFKHISFISKKHNKYYEEIKENVVWKAINKTRNWLIHYPDTGIKVIFQPENLFPLTFSSLLWLNFFYLNELGLKK